MNVYIFNAELLCEGCGVAARQGLTPAEDSNDYPQGPYANGGGEADCPQHCGHCHAFLGNPLTGEGVRYVRERLTEATGKADVLAEWAAFYELGPVTAWELVGKRVEIPASYDAWARGARFGKAHSALPTGELRVRMDSPRIRRLIWIVPGDLAFVRVVE